MDETSQQIEEQYADIAPRLRAYFRGQPALRDQTDDLLQETFLRAWRQRARVRSAISIRAYLFGIARHVGLDSLRRRRVTEPLSDEIPGDVAESTDERVELMRQAIARLPATHREPLLLKLHHELSYAEIAQVMDLPVGTVRSRLHHAVLRLQGSLNPQAPTGHPNPSTPPTP